MTEQTNAELIAEVRAYPPVSEWDEPGEADEVIRRLATALKAADRRAEVAEKDRRYETEQKLKLAAVVEKVRAYAESIPRTRDRDVNTRLSNRSWLTAQDVLYVLAATAPADALRERDAEKWGEGAEMGHRLYAEPMHVIEARNPYREEQS